MKSKSARHSDTKKGLAVDHDLGNQERSGELVQIAIKDARGRTVRTVTMGRSTAVAGLPSWDVPEQEDMALPAGIYSFSVNALPTEGGGFGASTPRTTLTKRP